MTFENISVIFLSATIYPILNPAKPNALERVFTKMTLGYFFTRFRTVKFENSPYASSIMIGPEKDLNNLSSCLFENWNPDGLFGELIISHRVRGVMAAALLHNDQQRFLTMARFEEGPNGNPHAHGFAYGAGNQMIGRLEEELPVEVSSDSGDGAVMSWV